MTVRAEDSSPVMLEKLFAPCFSNMKGLTMLAELTMHYDMPCDWRTVFRANELITVDYYCMILLAVLY